MNRVHIQSLTDCIQQALSLQFHQKWNTKMKTKNESETLNNLHHGNEKITSGRSRKQKENLY